MINDKWKGMMGRIIIFQNTNPVILCYLTSMSYCHIRPTRLNSLVYWKVGGIPNKIGRKPKASIEFEVRAVEWTQWLCVANLKNRFREHTCAKTWSRKHLTEPAGPGIKIRVTKMRIKNISYQCTVDKVMTNDCWINIGGFRNGSWHSIVVSVVRCDEYGLLKLSDITTMVFDDLEGAREP